jgi:hypothetical protein
LVAFIFFFPRRGWLLFSSSATTSFTKHTIQIGSMYVGPKYIKSPIRSPISILSNLMSFTS